MNILMYEKGPYSASKFEYAKTRTVNVTLDNKELRLRFPAMNLPYKKLYDEKIDKKIFYYGEPLVIDLQKASLLCLPYDLSNKK